MQSPTDRFRFHGPVVPMDKPKSYRLVWAFGVAGLVAAFAGATLVMARAPRRAFAVPVEPQASRPSGLQSLAQEN